MSLFGGGDGFSYISSRAVDDDDDEEIDTPISLPCILRWSLRVKEEIQRRDSHQIDCSLLLIGIGPAAAGSIWNYILDGVDTEVIGVICSGLHDHDRNTLDQTSPTDKTCYVYRLTKHPTILVVLCKTDVAPEQSFSWTEQLLSIVASRATQVKVLATSNRTEFKSRVQPGDLPSHFLRALRTDDSKEKPICPYLEQPNTVSGLPAQIVTYCQVKRVPCFLYMCYTNLSILEAGTMKVFRQVLDVEPLVKKQLVKTSQKCEEQLIRWAAAYSRHNTIYM